MRGLSLVVVALLAIGCSAGGDAPSGPWARATEVTTAEQQREVAHALAEATAAAIAPAPTPSPGEPEELLQCGGEDVPAGEPQQFTSSETREIPIGDRDPRALLRSTRDFWEQQGVEDLRNPETDESTSQLVGTLGQLGLSLTIFEGRALAVLEVSGACLPREGAAPATSAPTGGPA